MYAKAPTATRAGFIASGALVAIEFDHPISTTSLSTCAAIFSGLTSLGTSPTCKWTGRRYLIISPGVDATIVPNDSLTFKSGAVKRDETYAKALSGSVTIDGPRDPVRPVPVIVGKFFESLELMRIAWEMMRVDESLGFGCKQYKLTSGCSLISR